MFTNCSYLGNDAVLSGTSQRLFIIETSVKVTSNTTSFNKPVICRQVVFERDCLCSVK